MASRASVELHTVIYFRKRYVPCLLFLVLAYHFIHLSLSTRKICIAHNFWLPMQANRHGGQNSEDKIQWNYCICSQVSLQDHKHKTRGFVVFYKAVDQPFFFFFYCVQVRDRRACVLETKRREGRRQSRRVVSR